MPDAGFGMLLFGRETYRHLSADLHLKALKSSSEGRVHQICNAVTAGGEAWTLAAVLHQMGMRYPLPFVALAA